MDALFLFLHPLTMTLAAIAFNNNKYRNEM